MDPHEQVLVLDRNALFAGDWPQGFVPLDLTTAVQTIRTIESRGRFELRREAEDEPAWKQCIPYCAIVRGAEVLCVERRPEQGEARLHGRLSIGIGGHVGPQDGPLSGVIGRGLWRELQEELVLDPVVGVQARPIGLLNDDSNPVGRVHFGLVHLLSLPLSTQAPQIREISKMTGSFRRLAAPSGAWQDAARLESWSAALIPHLAPLLSRTC